MNFIQRLLSLLLVFLFLGHSQVFAASQKINGLYVNAFGNPKSQPVIFVHGGPGYNSWDFELTTAQLLANEGFYVVVYDERGQGRSDEASAKDFNYRQYADDIKTISDKLNLIKPILIGHSHGGPISLKFDQYYPGVAKSIVLISGPINFPGSIHSIFENCSRKYVVASNETMLDNLTFDYYQLILNPSASRDERVDAIGGTFAHGLQCGLYKTSHPTASEFALHNLLKSHPLTGPLTGLTTAMPGFVDNENYVQLNLVDYVVTNRSHIYGIYGDEDGLFSPLELSVIRNSVQKNGGPQHFQIIKSASHGIYIDQQDEFIKTFKKFAN